LNQDGSPSLGREHPDFESNISSVKGYGLFKFLHLAFLPCYHVSSHVAIVTLLTVTQQKRILKSKPDLLELSDPNLPKIG
jgi:hypothetical protein